MLEADSVGSLFKSASPRYVVVIRIIAHAAILRLLRTIITVLALRFRTGVKCDLLQLFFKAVD